MKTKVPVASHSFLSFCLFTDCFANSIIPSCIFGTAVARSPKTQIPFQAITNQEKQTQQTHIIEHLVGNSLSSGMHLGGWLSYFQTKSYCQINQAENSTMSANDWLLPCLLPRKCHLPRILGIWPLPKQSNPAIPNRSVLVNQTHTLKITSNHMLVTSSCRGLAISFYLDIQTLHLWSNHVIPKMFESVPQMYYMGMAQNLVLHIFLLYLGQSTLTNQLF